MSRRKPANRSAKRNVSKATASQSNSFEKAITDLQTKFLAQIAKEVSTIRQTENKTKTNIAKVKSQLAKAKNRTQTSTFTKTLASLTKSLQDNSNALLEATHNQAKMSAFRKEISAFEKAWAGKLKALKAKAAAKAKAKTKAAAKPKKTRKSSKKASASIIPLQSHMDTMNTDMDQAQQHHQATEMSS